MVFRKQTAIQITYMTLKSMVKVTHVSNQSILKLSYMYHSYCELLFLFDIMIA